MEVPTVPREGSVHTPEEKSKAEIELEGQHHGTSSDTPSPALSYKGQEPEEQNLPLMYIPPRLSPSDGPKASRRWLVHGAEVTEWLNLFFDLVVVAILNTFSTNTEMRTPQSVLLFFSYFAIVWWAYVSQTMYDVRFAAEDHLHRFYKLVLIVLFAYIGAGSSGWNPGQIEHATDPFDPETIVHIQAASSFKTIGIAYIITRFMLVLQYMVVAIAAHKAGRPKMFFIAPSAAAAFSGLCAIIALAIPAPNQSYVTAKLLFFYFGIGVEVVGEGYASFKRDGIRAPHHAISERFGALTLIILGEGIIHTLQAFNKAISAFSNNGITYVQVFLCVYNTYLLFLFLFSRFDKHTWMGRRRIYAWMVLHFPLHFSMLSALASYVNAILSVALDAGIPDLSVTLDPRPNETFVEYVHREPSFLTMLAKLDLVPAPVEFVHYLDEVVANRTDPDPNYNTGPISLDVLVYQYTAQIVASIYNRYGFAPDDHASHLLYEIETANTTLTTDKHNEHEVVALVSQLAIIYEDELSRICLWLLPSSGVVLMLVGITAAVREPQWYLAPVRRWAFVLQELLGVGLCFLAFLNKGYSPGGWLFDDTGEITHTGKLAPINRLVNSQWVLVVVALTWTTVLFAHILANRIVLRRKIKSQ